MKSKLGYILLFLAAALIVLSIFQQSKINRLKTVEAKYKLLAENFKDLHSSYESNLKEYQAIKSKLDLNKQHLDSLARILMNKNTESTTELEAVSMEINSAINNIDTLSTRLSRPINIDSLFN
ncbi:hypothetical protein [Fulvivirga lutea]|uniref:Uncharacterized protein n=1 Tax=Fulvivirga lutea TaxID=2810512 RepID=A0A974WE81_9BACT|nr:hypothetical protein [Fulvivirga lutea]QSE96689.1 hypothetical protein JR347_13945 [Fulvivirga lutea]